MSEQQSPPPEIASRVTDVAAFEPSLSELGRRSRLFPGLGFGTGYLWAGVTAEDGQRYAVLRSHGLDATALYFVLELSDDLWRPPAVRFAALPGLDGLYWGRMSYEEEPERQVIQPMNPAYRAFRLEYTPAGHRWIEDGVLDLALTPLGPAMRYRCPGPPDDFGYTSQICRVQGTIQGRSLVGFGGLDRSYHEHGVTWDLCKGYRRLEELWWVWAGIHEDGRREHGIVAAGRGDFRVGFFHRDGEAPVAATDVRHEIAWEERDGRRLPVSALLSFGGRRFRFSASGNVTLPGADLYFDWLHGQVVEEGGPAPAQRFSWMEYFKHLVRG